MDVLLALLRRMGAPPIISSEVMGRLAAPPEFESIASFPDPTFTLARTDKTGRRLPQAIAHRGYNAKFPENTMVAFRGAIEAGVHALETDVHLTKDGEVVLSHDSTLNRCFGIDKKIIDCDWKYVQELRTSKKPHEPMPRLDDVIEYLAQPEMSKIWLLLDIKMDNNAEDIMRQIAGVIHKIKPSDSAPWDQRIILGCWAANFLPLCHKYLPGFPITHIGFSIPYCRQFFAVPNVSFNILLASLVSPAGRNFIKDARARNRAVYCWTVNDTTSMDWCIRRNLDGVITDNPEKYLDYCKNFDSNNKIPEWTWQTIANFIRINFFAWIFGFLFRRKYGFKLDKRFLSHTTTR